MSLLHMLRILPVQHSLDVACGWPNRACLMGRQSEKEQGHEHKQLQNEAKNALDKL